MKYVYQEFIVFILSVDNVNDEYEYAIKFNDMKYGMVNIVVMSEDA